MSYEGGSINRRLNDLTFVQVKISLPRQALALTLSRNATVSGESSLETVVLRDRERTT